MGPTVPSIFMLIISASSCLGFSKQLSQYSNYFHCSQIWHTESSDKTRANSRAENVKRKSGKLKWTKQTGEKLVCRQELIEIELVFRWSATIHTAHSPSKLNWITAEKSSLYEEYNTHTHSYSVSDSDSDSLPSCYVYYSIFWRVCPDCCTFLAYFITLLCFGKIMNFTRYSPLLLLMFECILDTLARPLLLLLFAIF